MNLINRFIYFFIGLLFGVVILLFIWDMKGTKDFAYSPNSRVLKNITSKNIHFTANLHSAFAKNIITASEINAPIQVNSEGASLFDLLRLS